MASTFLGNVVDNVGSFFGLPEKGWSERLSGGMPTTNTGITPQSKAAGLDTWANYQYNQRTVNPSVNAIPKNAVSTSNSTGTPTGSTGQILGQQDNNTGESDAERAAREQAAAELQSLNTEFDRLSAMANDQMGQLGVERGNAMKNLDLQKQGLLTQVGEQKQDVMTARDKNIAAAGNVARKTQGSNRNMLRALGILNSSAGGDILSRPLEAFDEQRANFVSEAQGQVGKLDSFMNQKSAELAQAAKEVEDNYASLIGNIQTDLRFSARERADAIRQANAALGERLSQIKMSMQNYKQQVDAQKANIALQIAELQGYKFPNFNPGSITSEFFNPTNQGYKPQQVGLYTDQDKDRLSGMV